MYKPNILIFLSDQHHANYAGFAGHETVRTPHLDRIARSGTVFESAYTASPLCVPARCAFLTGQLPSRTGIYTNNGAIPEDQATFIHSLAAEGYETVLCGRMHFLGEDQRHGFTKRIMGEITPLFWGRGGYRRKDLGPFVNTLSEQRCLEVVGGGNSPVLEYDRAVIRAALNYLQENYEKPQCIIVGTYAPHFTYVAPPDLYQYYKERVEEPRHNSYATNYSHPILEERKRYPDAALGLDVRAAYFGMIENLDAQVGAVYNAWEHYLKRNQSEGLFMYLSDHGDQAGEHHMYGKHTFYEGSAKIPFMVAGNGVKSNCRIYGNVSMLDIGPTLCEIAGATAPPDQDGRSVAEVIFGGEDDVDRAIISDLMAYDDQGPIPARMVKNGAWKLMSYAGYEDYDLLFNLETDPCETTDLKEAQPEKYKELRNLLIQNWNTDLIAQAHMVRSRHFQILNKWGAAVDVEEKERWPVPAQALELPKR